MNGCQCIGELNEGMGSLELEWDFWMESVEYLDLEHPEFPCQQKQFLFLSFRWLVSSFLNTLQ